MDACCRRHPRHQIDHCAPPRRANSSGSGVIQCVTDGLNVDDGVGSSALLRCE